MKHCGMCHECGTPLKSVLDGEEYCPKCDQYRRYRSHGWVGGISVDETPCPEPKSSLPRYEWVNETGLNAAKHPFEIVHSIMTDRGPLTLIELLPSDVMVNGKYYVSDKDTGR